MHTSKKSSVRWRVPLPSASYGYTCTRKRSSFDDWNEGKEKARRKEEEEEEEEKKEKIDAFAYCRASIRVYIRTYTHACLVTDRSQSDSYKKKFNFVFLLPCNT